MKKTIISIAVLLMISGSIILLVGCQSKEVTSAKVYIQQDDWDKAKEQLEQAVTLYPNDPQAHFLLGEVYAREDNWEKMNEEYNKSLKIGPQYEIQIKNSREKNWVNAFNSGIAKINSGDIAGAIARFKNCTIINPSKVQAYQNLAFAQLKDNQTSEAEDTYLQLLNITKNDTIVVKTLSSLSSLYFQDEQYEKALEMEKKILEKEPDNVDSIAQMALILDHLGRTDEAFAAYEKALAENPNDKNLNFNLGRLYFLNKNYEDAIKQFKRVIETNPDDYDANVNVGNGYLSIADQMRKDLVEKEDKGEKVTSEDLDKMKQYYCDAISYLEKATSIKPDEANMWNNLGVAYVNCGEAEKGKAAFKKAEELGF